MARDPQGGSFNLPVVDEQTKAAGMRASMAAAKTAAEQMAEDLYYTKIVSDGKTQAQLDALANARTTAATIRDESTTMSARVDPATGRVITTPKGTVTPVAPVAPVPVVTPQGTVYTATDGAKFTDQAAYATYQASLNKAATDKAAADLAAKTKLAGETAARQSAYDLLYEEFNRYGLGSLVAPLKDLITSNVSPSEFTLRLRGTDAYKNRFAANEIRIKNGLRALSEADYIRNEDAYQEVMRRRGLPASYYEQTVDPVTGITKQKGFEALLAGDVSSTELEDRIVTAQDRVLNANPEIAATLKQFYPGISNGDILAYSLDPVNAINAIKRKITAAEIGTAAKQEGLTSGLSRAEELATMGVTKDIAAQGYKTIGGGLQRGSQLAAIYGENPYTQTSAEQEIFNLQGAQEARKQRQKVTGLEKATFSGQTGVTSGALARDRAGAY
jgi:hypothetical protein